MAAGNPGMAALFLMLTFLASSPDGQHEQFDFQAVLKENNVEMQVDPLMAVLAGPDARKVRPIIEQLGDADYDRREEATKRLETMGPAIVPLLKKYGLESADLEIRVRARKLISKILEGNVNYVPLHRAALAALGKLKAEKAVKLLEEYLDNDDSRLRRAAAFALAEIGGRKARRSLSLKIRDAAKKEGPAFLSVLEVLEGFALNAKEKDLDDISVLVGKGSRVVDLRVIELLAGSGSLRTWAGAVRTYIAAWDKEDSVPPQFIREFLTAVYGLKPDEKFDWTEFCGKAGKRVKKISGKNLETLREQFAIGLEKEKLIAKYEECFRFVPQKAGGVAGFDMSQLRSIALSKDLEKYLREDVACATAIRKLTEQGGIFNTDVVVMYMNVDISNGQGHFCLIARGNYDSAKQTELFARLFGWGKSNYNGIDYIKQKESRHGHVSLCFYDDRHVLFTYGFLEPAPMEDVIDGLLGKTSSILADKTAMEMLDRETLAGAVWCVGRLDKILSGAPSRRDEDLEKFLQMKEFVMRLSASKTGVSVNVKGRFADAKSAKDFEWMLKKNIGVGISEIERELKRFEEEKDHYRSWVTAELIETMKASRNFLRSVKIDAENESISGNGKADLEKLYNALRASLLPEISKQIIRQMENELPRTYVLEEKLKWAKEEEERRKKEQQITTKQFEDLAKRIAELQKQPDSPKKKAELDAVGERLRWRDESLRWHEERMQKATEKIEELKKELAEEKARQAEKP